MATVQIPKIDTDEFSRSKTRRQMSGRGTSLSPIRKIDADMRESIYKAFWQDDILRAAGDCEIDVCVENEVVYLSGHILNATSQSRIEDVIQTIPGILGLKNNLILDDELTLEVASALEHLEHIQFCKFFTGTSHGVVSLNGVVSDEKIKALAEKYVSNIPHVRGVINNVRVAGGELKLKNQPFLQPVPREVVYFLDGVFGVVKQVVINPNNRRVIAMILQGIFMGQRYELHSLTDSKEQLSEQQLITVPINAVRHLTKISGFLDIRSNERNRYVDFDPLAFMAPSKDWTPPYPYCSDDVLFPVKYENADDQSVGESEDFPFGEILEDASVRERFFANDSFGL